MANPIIMSNDYYIRQISSGYDEAIFKVSIYAEDYAGLQEESSIIDTETGIAYLVKAIDGGGEIATVKAQIDLDEWKASMQIGYDSGSHTVHDIIAAVVPTGWNVIDESSVSMSRTIKLDSATPLDVCEACRTTFSVTFRWDNAAKTITIKNPNLATNPTGAFVSKDLNMTQNNYKGKSTGLYNRLYAYGKDNLSIASVNPTGQPYVDCVPAYSGRVICAYWKDERYTDAQSLLEDAQATVNAAGQPVRSFDCSVVDLAAADPAKYSYLSFPLFSTITLIDETRAPEGVLHQVVERWHYPEHPEQDKVILSTAPQRVGAQLSQINRQINDRNSDWYQQFMSVVSTASEWITNTAGHVHFVRDADGLPTEIMIVNDTDPNKVWRWSAGGLGYSTNGINGPFTTAITADGSIVAQFVNTGILSALLIRAQCTDCYVRPNATAFTADWLSLSNGGAALVPSTGVVYHVLSGGIYNDKYYRWSGVSYVERKPVSSWNLQSDNMALYDTAITNTTQKTFHTSDYTSADVTVLSDIVNNNRVAQLSDYEKYDFDCNGTLNATDLSRVQQIVAGTASGDNTVTWTTQISNADISNPITVTMTRASVWGTSSHRYAALGAECRVNSVYAKHISSDGFVTGDRIQANTLLTSWGGSTLSGDTKILGATTYIGGANKTVTLYGNIYTGGRTRLNDTTELYGTTNIYSGLQLNDNAGAAGQMLVSAGSGNVPQWSSNITSGSNGISVTGEIYASGAIYSGGTRVPTRTKVATCVFGGNPTTGITIPLGTSGNFNVGSSSFYIDADGNVSGGSGVFTSGLYNYR